MAKENVANIGLSEVKSFIDKTDQKWFVKKGTKSIAFCESIEEMMDGKSEKFDFTETFNSQKTITNNKNEKVVKSDYFIFILKDGKMVLVRSYNKIK